MKKLIAVLLVVFACLSLSADDIPMNWSIQIVKALSDFSASDFESYNMTKLDDETVLMGKSGEAYYFRFNLTPEEIENDRVRFVEKLGELFSNTRAELYLTSYDDYKEFGVKLKEDYNEELKGYLITELYFIYDLEESCLSHYIHWKCYLSRSIQY